VNMAIRGDVYGCIVATPGFVTVYLGGEF
jgi:hypothetical protein